MATYKDKSKEMAATKARSDAPGAGPGLALIGFLLVQILVGYEWLVSGLTKIVNGDFTSGLAEEMSAKLVDAPGWYASFMNSVIIPNGPLFAFIIEWAELLIGIAFIGGALVWLFAWQRVPGGLRGTMLFLIALAGIGGIFMALNFHIANGLTHPWLIPTDSFEEAVDFDSLLVALDIIFAAVYIFFFIRFRQGKELA